MPGDSIREGQISEFLKPIGWATANRTNLAGDASRRSYVRLSKSKTGETAILMNAPPDKCDNTEQFINIARHLTLVGLNAPEIYFADLKNGFLLLQDFGDGLFSLTVENDPSAELELYEVAVDVLAKLHSSRLPKSVPSYSADMMTGFAALSYDWYLFGLLGHTGHHDSAKFQGVLGKILGKVLSAAPVLALRDFHSENLIWLPGQTKEHRVGLLDFQDAMSCHPAYDLASLLLDARRDVTTDVKDEMIARYVLATGQDKQKFTAAFSALSAQRNLRIIGGFARLSLKFGKPEYVDLLPRVWRNLMTDLEHPSLVHLQDIVMQDLPAPNGEIIEVLKSKCATHPSR